MKIIKYIFSISLLLFVTSISAATHPDTDRDGIPDINDKCPENSFRELSRGVESNGCPLQSDADKVPDYKDQCPNTPKGVKTNRVGCPVTLHTHASNRIFNNQAFINVH